MKIKNILMQWIVLTPLTAISSVLAWGLIVMFTGPEGEDLMTSMGGVGFIMVPFLVISICLGISKLLLKIKGNAVEYEYYDSDYEFELRHEYGDKYSVHQTKGGWSVGTKFIVWIYLLMSPIIFFLQLIANVFALVSFFNKRIASWYGGIDYDSLSFPIVQNILHFLFNFVILDKGCTLEK